MTRGVDTLSIVDIANRTVTDLIHVMVPRQENRPPEFVFVILRGVHELKVLVNNVLPCLKRRSLLGHYQNRNVNLSLLIHEAYGSINHYHSSSPGYCLFVIFIVQFCTS